MLEALLFIVTLSHHFSFIRYKHSSSIIDPFLFLDNQDLSITPPLPLRSWSIQTNHQPYF